MKIAMCDITAGLGVVLAFVHSNDLMVAFPCVFLAEVALVHGLIRRKHRRT